MDRALVFGTSDGGSIPSRGTMTSIIEVSNLVKKYKKAEKNAVDSVSFTVTEGSFFAFLGPNGAGKTTTISILTTTLSKTSGTVNIAGHDLDRESAKVRRAIGVIFQQPSLDLNLTAEENIRFHAVLYGLYPFRPTFALMPIEYRRRVQELAGVVGISGELFKPLKTFSGGMKRKLEIIRSLIHNPRVLFLDEPTSGLDPLSRNNLWEYLQEVRQKNQTTIFLTTHYLEEAEGADNVAVINHGKIVTQGTPEKIKQDLVDEYIVVDAKNRDALRAEVTRKKFSHRILTNGALRIDIGKNHPQKVIKSLDTPLTTLNIHVPSLEEAYLEIIGRQAHERS